MIFHNLRGYDSHLIMQDIGEIFRRLKMPINCVSNDLEQYIFLTLGNNLVFMDSFQFMSSSLENLVKNVPKCGKCDTCNPGKYIKQSINDEGD